MAKNFLYINRKGFKVSRNSYSGQKDFDWCKHLYKLKRIDGWREKGKSAAMEFGICLESAIQYYHEQGMQPKSCVGKFLELWFKFQDRADLNYGKKEKDWATVSVMGSGMAALYELWAVKNLTGATVRLQANFEKEVFPGTELAGIQETAYVDLWVKKNNETAIWDIKVLSNDFPDLPGFVALDAQMRRYAWLSGVRNVGILGFTKLSPALERGDEVTIVEGPDAGQVYRVMAQEKASAWLLDCSQYDQFASETKGKKISAEILNEWKGRNPIFCPLSFFTKQRLNATTATIDEEELKEIGESIGLGIAEIVMARQRNFYPKESGVRWPNDKCLHCPMRGICLKNDELRDQIVEQIDHDWIDEL